MKTLCVTSTWLDGVDGNGSLYIERLRKYYRYYRPLRQALGITDFLAIDNGSVGYVVSKYADTEIITLNPNYQRGEGCDYPYVWRYYFHIRNYLEQYDKILIIEDDSFILSKRMVDYVRERNTGWTAFWCDKWKFPEGNIQIICKDAFPLYLKFTEGDFMRLNGRKFETTAPFTHIETGFIGDRWGEDKLPAPGNTDYYCQCALGTEMRYTG